ncbi:MAG: hypothetical protein H7Z17_15945 [Fuerstia sp.]|nr:hypothetical protein [Fuerstiella sp.]
MTVEQIMEELKPEKPVSRDTIYEYFKKLGIRPVGQFRQRPQQYPDDAATVIRSALGLPANSKRR